MSDKKYVLLVAIFQFVPLLLYPPDVIFSIEPVFLIFAVVLFAFVGWRLVLGRTWASIFSTFLQGFNIITRLAMIFPHALVEGRVNYPFVITAILAISISIYFLYLLGKTELDASPA